MFLKEGAEVLALWYWCDDLSILDMAVSHNGPWKRGDQSIPIESRLCFSAAIARCSSGDGLS